MHGRASRKSNKNNFRPCVDLLEDRCLLTSWPFGGAPALLGTYGQYQDRSDVLHAGAYYDINIHMHEGIDIPIPSGFEVKAVQRGVVEMVYPYNLPNNVIPPNFYQFSAFVVIRDGTPEAQGDLGWNYKHLVPSPALRQAFSDNPQARIQVQEGDVIGNIAPTGSTMPSHLHLDRGPAYTFNVNNAAAARDPTMQTMLATMSGIEAFPPQTIIRNAIRYQVPPLINPLTEFLPLVTDGVAPTVSQLDFRLAESDQYGALRELSGQSILGGAAQTVGGPFHQPSEVRRPNAKYFQNRLLIHGGNKIHLGRFATAQVDNPSTATVSGERRNANIDFVALAYDQINGSNTHLNPSSFDIRIAGQKFGADVRRDSFSFESFYQTPTNFRGVGQFFDMKITRAVYENDNSPKKTATVDDPAWIHDSHSHFSTGLGTFYYNLTNSRRLTDPTQRSIEADDLSFYDRDFYWNSDTGNSNNPFWPESSAFAYNDNFDASKNADALFPDDVYEITIGASDLKGNRGTQVWRVVLTNWQRTITTDKNAYSPNEPIGITGGDQYRAFQQLKIHIISAGNAVAPATGTQLNDAWQWSTNGNGELNPGNYLMASPPGRYFLIADYNGDDEYTKFMDAFKVITVSNPQMANLTFAVDDSYEVVHDTILNIAEPGVLGNDYNMLDAALTARKLTNPAHGTVDLHADGSFEYTPYEHYVGDDSFTYKANVAPKARDDVYTVLPGDTLTIDAIAGVLANDNDDDGDPITATLVSEPAFGTLEFAEDGSFTYTPAEGFSGPDSFTYSIDDGVVSSTATVTIDVTTYTGEHDDACTVDENDILDVAAPGVLENDGNEPMTVALVRPPRHGQVSLNEDGAFTYIPSEDYSGSDSFTYVATGTTNVVLATVKIEVAAPAMPTGDFKVATVYIDVTNQKPYPEDDEYSVYQGETLAISAPGVLENDDDPDGDDLTAVLDSGPANGTLTLNGDGSFSYTPTEGFLGTDYFTYYANDGPANSDFPATVTIHVTNNPPSAGDDSATTDEDTPVDIDVLANDSDPDDDPLTITIATAPAHGVAWVDDNGTPEDLADDFVTYWPDENFNGSDDFSYQVDDGYFGFATATVTITVNPVNDPPMAQDDNYETDEDTTLNGASVLVNDDDSFGGAPGENNLPMTAVLVTGPEHAVSFTFNVDGTFTYTPAADYNGTDSFTYKAIDGLGGQSNVATATITIHPDNDKPTADDLTIGIAEDTPLDFTLTGQDVETPPGDLIFTIITQPEHGTLIVDGANLTYIPDLNYNGADSFQFTVTDTGEIGHSGGGSLTSDPATVSINVAPVNDSPVAVNDDVLTENINQVTIAVLTNDFDVDGDALTVISVTQPGLGSASVTGGGTTVTWTHIGIMVGPGMWDEFQYTISDGNGGTGTATVHITWGEPQLFDGEPLPAEAGTTDLTHEQLQPVIADAIAWLHAAGYDVSVLIEATFQITDLPGALLGLTAGTNIWIDESGAGQGFYLGGLSGGLVSGELVSGEWSNQIDLLTVVTHEFGHILGFASIDTRNNWMTATLAPGVRRLPEPLTPDASPQGGEGSVLSSLIPDSSPQGRAGSLMVAVNRKLPLWSAPSDASIDLQFSFPLSSDFLTDSYRGQPAIGSPLVLDFALITDESPLATQDFDLAEPMPLDGGDGLLVAGDGCDIVIIGEPGEMVLIGGFAD